MTILVAMRTIQKLSPVELLPDEVDCELPNEGGHLQYALHIVQCAVNSALADITLHNTVYSSIIQYNTVQYSTVPGHTAQIAVARHPMLFPGGHRSELAWPRTASP